MGDLLEDIVLHDFEDPTPSLEETLGVLKNLDCVCELARTNGDSHMYANERDERR